MIIISVTGKEYDMMEYPHIEITSNGIVGVSKYPEKENLDGKYGGAPGAFPYILHRICIFKPPLEHQHAADFRQAILNASASGDEVFDVKHRAKGLYKEIYSEISFPFQRDSDLLTM